MQMLGREIVQEKAMRHSTLMTESTERSLPVQKGPPVPCTVLYFCESWPLMVISPEEKIEIRQFYGTGSWDSNVCSE